MISINYIISPDDFSNLKKECLNNKWIQKKTVMRLLWLKMIISFYGASGIYLMLDSLYFGTNWFNHSYHILFTVLAFVAIFCFAHFVYNIGRLGTPGYIDGTLVLHHIGNEISLDDHCIKITNKNNCILQTSYDKIKDANISYQNIVIQLYNGMFVFVPRRVFASYHIMNETFNEIKTQVSRLGATQQI